MVNIEIQKKDLWLISAIFIFIAGITLVISFDSGQPSIHGHDVNEIQGAGGGGSGGYSPTWTPVDINLGALTRIANVEQSFDLAAAGIPTGATEVLIFGRILWGNTPQNSAYYDFYTKDGSTKYLQKLYFRQFNVAHTPANSDNMWFPVTSDMKLYIKLSQAAGSNSFGEAKILGYRTGGSAGGLDSNKFGGMFTTGSSGTCDGVNPLTGDCSCPAGFTQATIADGVSGQEQYFYLCWK